MKIGINPDKKILTIDNEQFEFKTIHMGKAKPYWLVELADGGRLAIDFSQSRGWLIPYPREGGRK